MNNNELRIKISKILIKWAMPTRQSAINELISLIDLYGMEEVEKQQYKKHKKIINKAYERSK